MNTKNIIMLVWFYEGLAQLENILITTMSFILFCSGIGLSNMKIYQLKECQKARYTFLCCLSIMSASRFVNYPAWEMQSLWLYALRFIV